MYLLLFFAWLAGFVTVLSPCILPVLPILLAAGAGAGRLRPYGIIVGLVLSFTFFTLSLGALVRATGISPQLLRYSAIAIIAFFGCVMIFEPLAQWFASVTSSIARLGTKVQEKSGTFGTGFLSGFILGIALGLIWTPCAGPILASIITLVATHAITGTAVAVTLAYSLGAAVPMLLIIIGSKKIMDTFTIVGTHAESIRKLFGILMILGALALAFHFDSILQQFTMRYFPMVTLEDNPLVEKELEALTQSKSINIRPDSNGVIHAPDFVGIAHWLNTQPLTIKDLRGKVVLVDFWTYSCINCVRTMPHLKEWYNAYKNDGFVIVGVHTPEFEFEKSVQNVQAAINRFGLTYPVAMDNDFKTWQNYGNRYWPAHYLIDQQGRIVHTHFGEGGYAQTENAIRSLLSLAPLKEGEARHILKPQTPETYLGYERAQAYQLDAPVKHNQEALYSFTPPLPEDKVGLQGMWNIGPESITSAADDATLSLSFLANHVYLVMQSPEVSEIAILLDGKPVPKEYFTADMRDGVLRVHDARMYNIVDLNHDYGRHTLTMKYPKNVTAYAFTFGANSH